MLKLNLQYRESDYFNDKDYFVFDNGLKGLLVSKVEFSKGFWWTVESLKFKTLSIPSQNANELYQQRVKLKDLEYYGTLCKFLSPIKGEICGSFGVVWDGGSQIKKCGGLANFWTNTRYIELDYQFN